MKLASLLQRELILCGASAASYAGAQQDLLELLGQAKGIAPAPLASALAERERLGSTLIAPGIAFPHARVSALDDFYMLLATYPAGIPVAGQDEPVRLVVLYLLGEGQSNLYLRCVSTMARFLSPAGRLEQLVEAKSPRAILDLIEGAGVLVQEVVTAADIIKPDCPRATPATTLREVADLMVINRTTHIPVVDGSGRYLGIVDANRLLKIGLPDYLLAIGNISFLSTFEPFEELLKQEQSTTADCVLHTEHPTFMGHTPMIVVAAKLVRDGLFSAPVIDCEGRLLGMISTLDFVHKVVRA